MADFEARKLDELDHRTDDASAPEVFFTSVITPESLIGAYHALGRKPQGNVAIKIHSGESEKSNNLNPALVKDLVQELGGTLVECATAYDGNRETPEKSLAVFKERGYADIAPIQIMDMGGEIEIPVAKHRHIAYDIVGKHIDDYDSIFVLSHFKGHPMGGFGGALKQLSIGCASSYGKAYIHGAGEPGRIWTADHDSFLDAMADAASSVAEYFKDKTVFINVMKNMSVDCDCCAVAEDPCMKDIGILASLDPVAIDQACIDLVMQSDDPGREHFMERVNSRNGIHTIEAAAELGFGSRAYDLTEL